MCDIKEQNLANQMKSIFKTGKLSEVKIEEIKGLEPDHTTLASRVDGNNTRGSYTQEVADKVDVDVNHSVKSVQILSFF